MTREEVIIKIVKGKDVLDIGSVGQTDVYNLWQLLSRYAGKLTGIDIEPSCYPNVVCGNMETYDFGRQFDAVIAGDVLEHVDNQGLFLENIKKHLKPGGYLVITTPNAKWLTAIFKPNPTHSCWHDRYTLHRILNRCGFSPVYFRYYCGNKSHYSVIKRILAARQAMLAVCQAKL